MKIFVLGSNGMLGRYVYTYFKSEGYNVVEITRKVIHDITLLNQGELDYALYKLGLDVGDVVINCIGLIKQRFISLFYLNVKPNCAQGINFHHQ